MNSVRIGGGIPSFLTSFGSLWVSLSCQSSWAYLGRQGLQHFVSQLNIYEKLWMMQKLDKSAKQFVFGGTMVCEKETCTTNEQSSCVHTALLRRL